MVIWLEQNKWQLSTDRQLCIASYKNTYCIIICSPLLGLTWSNYIAKTPAKTPPAVQNSYLAACCLFWTQCLALLLLFCCVYLSFGWPEVPGLIGMVHQWKYTFCMLMGLWRNHLHSISIMSVYMAKVVFSNYITLVWKVCFVKAPTCHYFVKVGPKIPKYIIVSA